MMKAPNVRGSHKKHSKHSSSAGSTNRAGTQLSVPVMASAAPDRTKIDRGNMSSGGHGAAKLRRALAKLNLLSLSSSRYGGFVLL